MKRQLFFAAVFGLCFVFVGIWITRHQDEKHRKAELYLLEQIQLELSNRLEDGRPLPTNWTDITDSTRWKRLNEISKANFIPPATELYALLPQAVVFTNYHPIGVVFLIRSTPRDWPALPRGRWALLATSNIVHRTWIDEGLVSPEIKSQLTNSLR